MCVSDYFSSWWIFSVLACENGSGQLIWKPAFCNVTLPSIWWPLNVFRETYVCVCVCIWICHGSAYNWSVRHLVCAILPGPVAWCYHPALIASDNLLLEGSSSICPLPLALFWPEVILVRSHYPDQYLHESCKFLFRETSATMIRKTSWDHAIPMINWCFVGLFVVNLITWSKPWSKHGVPDLGSGLGFITYHE